MPFLFAAGNSPSFQFVRQNPNEAEGGGSSRCSGHSTLVANSTLVLTASPMIGPVSYSSSLAGRAPNSVSGGFSSSSQRCNAPLQADLGTVCDFLTVQLLILTDMHYPLCYYL